MVKYSKTPFEGKVIAKILWGVPCMMLLWKPLNSLGEYLVHARLDCCILSENCKKYICLACRAW